VRSEGKGERGSFRRRDRGGTKEKSYDYISANPKRRREEEREGGEKGAMMCQDGDVKGEGSGTIREHVLLADGGPRKKNPP